MYVEGAARRVAEEPDVWTDGSLVDDKMSGVFSAGAGCFTFWVSRRWASWNWGHWGDDVGDGSVVSACRGFCSVPGPLQTVQRAELWCVILAPPDGDLLLLIERMLHFRGLNTVRISKVKGHADEALVRAGAVRGLDKLGNDGADEAAAFGRTRVPWWDMDARRNFFWCLRRPIVLPCIVSLLLFLGLWLIMMVVLVLLLILLSGRLVVLLRSDGLRCGIGFFLPGPPDL